MLFNCIKHILKLIYLISLIIKHFNSIIFIIVINLIMCECFTLYCASEWPQMSDISYYYYSRTPLIRPPSESHWCGRIGGMVAREGFVYEQKPLSVTRNVVV